MITHEIPAPLFLPPSKTPRSAGIHVSGIIRAIAIETGILKPEMAEELSLVDVREITDPVAILRISVGLAWEQYFIETILGPTMGVIDHPGELHIDGIFMSPDGESVDVLVTKPQLGMVTIVHECKASWKSTRSVGDLSTQWLWLAQLRSYCRALKTRYARMHVLFLCGDYKFPITPQLKCFEVEFTEQELVDNWQLLTDYRDARLAKEKT